MAGININKIISDTFTTIDHMININSINVKRSYSSNEDTHENCSFPVINTSFQSNNGRIHIATKMQEKLTDQTF